MPGTGSPRRQVDGVESDEVRPDARPVLTGVADGEPVAVGRLHVGGRPVVGAVTAIDTHGDQLARTHTDEQGHFRLPVAIGSAADGVVLVASGPGFAPVATLLRDGHTTVDLDASPTTGVIDGNIAITGGEPAHGAAVLLLSGGSVVAHASTDAAGRFRFDELVAGEYVLSAHVPGGNPRTTLIELPPSGHVEV